MWQSQAETHPPIEASSICPEGNRELQALHRHGAACWNRHICILNLCLTMLMFRCCFYKIGLSFPFLKTLTRYEL